VLRGRVIFFLAKLMLGLLGLGTTAMLTRWVGPTEYGAYAFGLSIILFTVGAGFGWLNLSLQRFRPGFREPEFLFGTLIVVFCALCCAIAAVAGLGIMLTNSWRYAPFLAACLFAIFAAAWFELKQRVQLAELQAAPYFWTNVVRGTLILLLTFAAAYTQQSVTTMILATGVSTLIAASLFRTAHLDIFNWRFDREIGHMLFQFGLPVFVGFGVANVLISIDRWMLQLLSGSKAVGLFTATSLVAQVPIALLASGIGPSANALAVRAYEFTDGTTVKAQLEENLVSLLGIVLPAAVGITALSRNLAFVLVGENFAPAVIELAPWLCVASTLWAVRANYFDSAFHLARNTRPLIMIMSVTLAANVAVDFWLIPWQAELGAAIGSCIALGVGFAVAVIASRRVYKLPFPFKETAKVVVASALMYFVLQTVADSRGVGALFVQLTIGSLVYLTSIVALDVLQSRQWLVRQLTGWLAQRGLLS
jgi:O-antigen/teichoic acid export membrane protein